MFNMIFTSQLENHSLDERTLTCKQNCAQEILFSSFLTKREDIFMQLCRVLSSLYSSLFSLAVCVKEQIGTLY